MPLTVDLSFIADDDGLPPALNVQWLRGTSPTALATTTTYVPVGADVGQTLRVRVNYTDLHGTNETRLSAATTAVIAAPPPPPPPPPPAAAAASAASASAAAVRRRRPRLRWWSRSCRRRRW